MTLQNFPPINYYDKPWNGKGIRLEGVIIIPRKTRNTKDGE